MIEMKLKIHELISGKVYKCNFLKNKCEYDLLWANEDSNKISSSIFIFLGYSAKSNSVYTTLKGLIDGKILYAKECCGISFYFEELK